MFNLIGLEIRKFKLQKMNNGVILADLILLIMIILLGVITKADNDPLFLDINQGVIFVVLMVMATFIIYGSVLLAKLTISEYKNKTIQLMFMYPISRKKLLISKLIIVYLFTSINVLVGTTFVLVGISIADHFIDFIPGILTLKAVKGIFPMIGVGVITSGFLAIVPLFFGMRKKSTSHTIIAAVIIVCIMASNTGDVMELNQYFIRIAVLGTIAVVSIILTMIYTLNNIDSVDIE